MWAFLLQATNKVLKIYSPSTDKGYIGLIFFFLIFGWERNIYEYGWAKHLYQREFCLRNEFDNLGKIQTGNNILIYQINLLRGWTAHHSSNYSKIFPPVQKYFNRYYNQHCIRPLNCAPAGNRVAYSIQYTLPPSSP